MIKLNIKNFSLVFTLYDIYCNSYLLDVFRLLDVIHSDKKLFLVFEYLNQDLKKYMDTAPPSGISLPLVKVLG